MAEYDGVVAAPVHYLHHGVILEIESQPRNHTSCVRGYRGFSKDPVIAHHTDHVKLVAKSDLHDLSRRGGLIPPDGELQVDGKHSAKPCGSLECRLWLEFRSLLTSAVPCVQFAPGSR